MLLFPDRLYQYKGLSSIPPSVLPFLSSLACSFGFVSLSHFHFPCSFLLQHHSYGLGNTGSQFPSTLCIPLLLLVISFLSSLSCFLFSENFHTPFHPLRLAHTVLESRISVMSEIKFLLLPQWFCFVLLDTDWVSPYLTAEDTQRGRNLCNFGPNLVVIIVRPWSLVGFFSCTLLFSRSFTPACRVISFKW